jgi:hypothetical protein
MSDIEEKTLKDLSERKRYRSELKSLDKDQKEKLSIIRQKYPREWQKDKMVVIAMYAFVLVLALGFVILKP